MVQVERLWAQRVLNRKISISSLVLNSCMIRVRSSCDWFLRSDSTINSKLMRHFSSLCPKPIRNRALRLEHLCESKCLVNIVPSLSRNCELPPSFSYPAAQYEARLPHLDGIFIMALQVFSFRYPVVIWDQLGNIIYLPGNFESRKKYPGILHIGHLSPKRSSQGFAC